MVAPELIGCLLVKRQADGCLLWGLIVEQEAVAPDEPHKFARRLSWDGLSEEEFETWLKSDCTDPKEGSSAWANKAGPRV